MTAHALSALGAGFSNEALGSQAVFRAVLQALSQPGQPVRVDHDAQVPAVGHSASAAACDAANAARAFAPVPSGFSFALSLISGRPSAPADLPGT